MWDGRQTRLMQHFRFGLFVGQRRYNTIGSMAIDAQAQLQILKINRSTFTGAIYF
jgi:hypothetical protein